ncbi:exodeoxyribonuclease V subunit gamma [Endozoicomonas sp. (ex Bugula neritina AB1)]|nr:exodeoxyribonuclease V subunit gamma [Endozoicomonas sp. (ex Bugula neritina AB1)]
MLTIYHSNRLDVLKDLLVELIRRAPPSNPLANEQILVQSPGMAQWLRLQMAEGLGIAAGIEFPLPASFLWEMYTRVLPDIPRRSAFNKEAMTWKIMALLPTMIHKEHFEPLRHYLEDDDEGMRCFQLSGKIADIFDQYLVYRPDWINDWEQQLDSAGATAEQLWQPELWRTLVTKTAELGQSPWHRANMHHRFLQELAENPHRQHLPDRLFIFGISALPPHFVESIEAIASQTDVHMMIMNPCQHYWGDERDPKYLRKLAAKTFAENQLSKTISSHGQHEHWLDKDGLSLENLDTTGNPLLGSMGKLGRDYLHQLHDLDAFDVDVFVPNQNRQLLQQIQQDILNLEDRTQAPSPTAFVDDRSLQFHSCHSPLREVEVLHDRLLDMFEQNPDLNPRDIVVMLPDIDSYSPWIQAVFGSINDHRRIPFSISDRSARSEHPILPALLHLLELDRSRCTAPELLELLEVPALQATFSLSDSDLNTLRRWVDASGIRWGLDGYHQGQFDVPELQGNTWLFGLRRMLMGYAMPESLGLQEGILPFDQVQGMEAALAGQLASFIDQAEQLAKRLDRKRSMEEWTLLINDLIGSFFTPDEEDEYALKIVRDALEQLHEQLIDADHQQPLSRAIMLSYLTERLNSERSSQKFLAGQINFCTLMPMRSIPFKVVCLLGMNDGAYPRSIPPAGFDLIAKHSRRGDRSRRVDDRYLFLEALLSSQNLLYISYVGHRIQDNSERIPSVLVSELLDYCQQGFGINPAQLLTEHTLQAYSPGQFDDQGKLFSYAHEWLPAAARQGSEPPPFYQKTGLPEQEVPPEIELPELLRFYKNPCKHFCNRRLKVYFDNHDPAIEETEPFDYDTLESYLIQEELLRSMILEESPQTVEEQLKGRGHLFHGAFGQLWLDEQRANLNKLANTVKPLISNPQDDLQVNLSINGYQITGWLKSRYESGMVRYRPTGMKGKDIINSWIEHLCNCASGYQQSTALLGTKEYFMFNPVTTKEAKGWLERLLYYFITGQNAPLPWFPQTAYSWVKADPLTNRDKAMKAALISFNGGFKDQPRAEKSDPYIARIYPELEPVMTEFDTIATELMTPALAAMESIKS